MRYGTFTTMDCPTKRASEAYQFLTDNFEKIQGNVRKVSNPHDFGSYPSFEIDYPYNLEFVDDDDCFCREGSCADCEKIAEKGEWIDRANKIESAYSKKFEKHL
jgi:hypothetical protein|tara:strand:- start:344 stop:655 length:312 start_codon:yes stop_codon:yes gene_type:complete